MISLIAAIDEGLAIGHDNRLLVRLPNDLKYFKRVTSGHPVIMGRKTYESLPVKPLPGRKNIVVSATSDEALPDCLRAGSIEDALAYCEGEECFVIGGMQLYRQMMPFADKLYITRIHHRFPADAFFPPIDAGQWQLESTDPHPRDKQHPYPYTFEIYARRKK
ncbi:MAG: dihydrofolate reductase [Bacteroidales bacterium]|jgi:dihydrofolate reductase|nr:dihydrofolate reductase [Bacteroidales bacterium]